MMVNARILITYMGHSIPKNGSPETRELGDIPNHLKRVITKLNVGDDGSTRGINWKRAKKYSITLSKEGLKFWVVICHDANPPHYGIFAVVVTSRKVPQEYAKRWVKDGIKTILRRLNN